VPQHCSLCAAMRLSSDWHAGPRSRSRASWSLASLIVASWRVQWAASVYDPIAKIESARLYGNVDSFAYWFVDLLVGSPTPQLTSVIIDTGSTIAGFPCAGCDHCGKHLDALFDISRSATATWVNCSGDCTAGCSNGKCLYAQTYTEGSSISGYWFRDYIALGDAPQHNPPVVAQVGCHREERKLFYTQRANGILGLAPHRGGRPTILTDLFHDTAHVNRDVFSICLATWGGKLSVGGYNASLHTAALQWIPLTFGRYYEVVLSSMDVGGADGMPSNVIGVGQDAFGVAMLDSGTTYTYFPDDIYLKLDAAIVSYCASHAGCLAVQDGSCWSVINTVAGPSSFPLVGMYFSGVLVHWSPQSYLYQRGETNKWCRAYASNGDMRQTVLGATWMLNRDVILDFQTQMVGIAEANCPSHRRVPTTSYPIDITNKFLDTPPVAVAASSSKLWAATVCTISVCIAVVLSISNIVRVARHWHLADEPEADDPIYQE